MKVSGATVGICICSAGRKKGLRVPKLSKSARSYRKAGKNPRLFYYLVIFGQNFLNHFIS